MEPKQANGSIILLESFLAAFSSNVNVEITEGFFCGDGVKVFRGDHPLGEASGVKSFTRGQM